MWAVARIPHAPAELGHGVAALRVTRERCTARRVRFRVATDVLQIACSEAEQSL